MKLEPIFGQFQRDGRNAHGRTMFKCLKCDHRTTWKNTMNHFHKDVVEDAKEEVKEEDAPKALN